MKHLTDADYEAIAHAWSMGCQARGLLMTRLAAAGKWPRGDYTRLVALARQLAHDDQDYSQE